MNKTKIAKGRIVSFTDKDKTHNYVAIFDHVDGDCFWCSRFLVHRTKSPTLKNNEGDGEHAMFYSPSHSALKVLRRKNLP